MVSYGACSHLYVFQQVHFWKGLGLFSHSIAFCVVCWQICESINMLQHTKMLQCTLLWCEWALSLDSDPCSSPKNMLTHIITDVKMGCIKAAASFWKSHQCTATHVVTSWHRLLQLLSNVDLLFHFSMEKKCDPWELEISWWRVSLSIGMSWRLGSNFGCLGIRTNTWTLARLAPGHQGPCVLYINFCIWQLPAVTGSQRRHP